MAKNTPKTVEEVRAAVEAAKAVAMARFRQDWGTDNPREVVEAIRAAVPHAKGWADAAARAHATMKARRGA